MLTYDCFKPFLTPLLMIFLSNMEHVKIKIRDKNNQSVTGIVGLYPVLVSTGLHRPTGH